jgi:luciferase family oxidoreductase group 1
MRLSVLDQIPIPNGSNAREAIDETFRLAELADQLGYHRYWLAEHHNTSSLACPAPEVMIPQVAARTQRIRVGSGGVMLTHYSPLKVAEAFHLIEALHPGRIDLGVGRAPGSDGRTARALAQGPGVLGIEHYPEQLLDLYGYLAADLPPEHPFNGVRAMPEGVGLPELWLLGSSTVSATYAAEIGWGFSFAQFISPEVGEAVIRNYRERFHPSPVLQEPHANMGVSVTCAETEAEAKDLCWSRWCWRIMRNRGLDGGIPSVHEARSFPYNERELEYVEYMQGISIYGTPQQCRERLEAIGRLYDVDEIVVLTITHDPAARRRSYELIAGAFDLERADTPEAQATT